MSRILPCLALATIAAAAPAAIPPRTVPHFERAAGVLDDIGPTTMVFSGGGMGTHFGRYTITGSHEYDAFGQITDGEFMTTTADGATISGTYSGTYEPLPSGEVRFDVHVLWLDGTGRLAGVTGEADVVAVLDSVAPGARLVYVTEGTLTFP